MPLSLLQLSHFRSHRTARLALDGRPVALFGPNGAGKTNVLEALSLLSPGRGLRRAGAEEIARKPESLGWKVTAALTGHEVETWAEGSASREVRIDGKAAPQLALARVARVLWLVPAMDRLWLDGAEARRRFLDRMVMSFIPAHAEAVLAYDKAMRDRNRLLKDLMTDGAWYQALEAQMAGSGAEITRNRLAVLDRIGAALAATDSAFPAADLALVGPDGEAAAASGEGLAEALAQGRRRDMAAGRTLTGPHRVDMAAIYRAKGIVADQCSTGEQKALLISLILANARALAADHGTPPILLLDEVAAHLDAARRTALYDEICQLGAQAFMTGTGVELFTDLRGRAQFYEVTESAGLSTITERAPV